MQLHQFVFSSAESSKSYASASSEQFQARIEAGLKQLRLPRSSVLYSACATVALAEARKLNKVESDEVGYNKQQLLDDAIAEEARMLNHTDKTTAQEYRKRIYDEVSTQ